MISLRHSRKMCVLLVLGFLLNSAGALASTQFWLSASASSDARIQATMPTEDMPADCHREHPRAQKPVSTKSLADHKSIVDMKEMASECCEDNCSCLQTGCHSPVAAVNAVSLVLAGQNNSYPNAMQEYASPILFRFNPPPIS